MEHSDFSMPSPKRQRTDSPQSTPVAGSHDVAIESTPMTNSLEPIGLQQLETAQVQKFDSASDQNIASAPLSTPVIAQNDMLDTLMQHVEAESTPTPGLNAENIGQDGTSLSSSVGITTNLSESNDVAVEAPTSSNTAVVSPSIQDTSMTNHTPHPKSSTLDSPQSFPLPNSSSQPSYDLQNVLKSTGQENREGSSVTGSKEIESLQPALTTHGNSGFLADVVPASMDAEEHLRAAAEVNVLPSTAENLAAQQLPQEKEWETDSSPYDSSDTDSDSSDETSSDDSDGDGDEAAEGYTMLDAVEQARILMQDAGSDDEGERGTARGGKSGLRTANERAEEILPKPDIIITENMVIEELGHVENTVEDVVLIKAKTSGEYHVLESGSLLCLQDRKVIGVVSETLGRVEEPLYTVRFGSDKDIQDTGVADRGTKIYYVKQHSTFVFTQPLRAVKGSDASNIHDEEVGEHEMEFSDDEAEAEHKRQLKLKRRGIDPNNTPSKASGRSGRGSHRGRGGFSQNQGTGGYSDTQGTSSAEMNYDDVEEGETDYTPLRRPPNMYEANGNHAHGNQTTVSSNTFRGGNRGRGQHHGRGRGRGNARPSNMPNQSPTQSNFTPPNGDWSTDLSNNLYILQQAYAARNAQQMQFGQTAPTFNFPTPPAPPSLTPQNSGHNGTPTFSPSPISPLPPSQFNFPSFGSSGMFAPIQGQHFSSATQQNPYNFQQQPVQQQHTNTGANSWTPGPQFSGVNSAAASLVEQHLEELRRTGGAGPNGNGTGK